MKTITEVGDLLPYTLLDNYVQRYQSFMKQRSPHAMGWKDVAYGYTIALIDDIAYLIQHCDYDTRTTLIFQLKAKAPTLWERVQEEMSKPNLSTT